MASTELILVHLLQMVGGRVFVVVLVWMNFDRMMMPVFCCCDDDVDLKMMIHSND